MTSKNTSLNALIICFALIAIPVIARSQTWSDSLSKEDRFWSRSGGMARELSMGSGGFGMLADSGILTVTANPYSVDPSFMLQNPAYASRYPGYIWFDVGLGNGSQDDGTGQSFGGTFAASDNFTVALILARSDAVGFTLLNPNIFSELTTLAQDFSYTPAQNTWQALGSLQVGQVSVGLGVSYAASSASSGSGGIEDSSARSATFHQLGFSTGVLYRAPDQTMLDVGATLLMPTLSATSTTGDLSMTALGVNARMFIPLKDEFYLVPIANLYYESGTSTFISTPKDLPSSQDFDLGIGVNFWQGGLHVMSGFSFGYYDQTTPAVANVTPEVSKSQTIVPRWNIGAEWPILKWLTARFGYFASSGSQTNIVQQSTNTTDTISNGQPNLYSPVYGFASSGFTSGVTFNIWNMNIDATINDETFHSGPASLFGGGSIFGFVTLGYRF